MKPNNTLYILATPIGNLKEVTPLLIEQLENLKTLFCEDTRVTKNLLNLLNIKNKPELISFHKFNENEKISVITKYLMLNDCGLISDAGYPTISDPGYNLIEWCHQNDVMVRVVNGCCAINHAISQSGFCSHGFIFLGFISKKPNEIIVSLKKHLNLSLPIVFFVSVHQVNKIIDILKQHFFNHRIYIGRELSKKFESYYVGLVKDITVQVEKGEFCFIIDSNHHENDESINVNVDEELKLMLSCNIKLNDACKYLAKRFNLNKNDLYQKYIKVNHNKTS